MARSSIEWTERTWNPVTGCTEVGCECDNCYARALAERLRRMGLWKYRNGFEVTLHPELLHEPLSWKKPSTVFVCSMADLFHAKVPRWFLHEAWRTMRTADRHAFQVLTKRIERVGQVFHGLLAAAPNVWLGTSVGRADFLHRVDTLRKTPAAVRFLSLEPLLGPLEGLELEGIDWVIAGGESGPRARPMDPGWVRSIRDSCLRSGVPFFFKQWGGTNKKRAGRILDGRTWDEMPAASRGSGPRAA